jgi:prepilin-type N-terminal cleavage/methylation domain-containing protein
MPTLFDHVRTLPANHRRGITLIELLVVMVILSIVTAASIPLLTTGVEQRRVRESARLVASYISSSKARAIETGRPAGVMIQRYLPASVGSGNVLQSLPEHAFSLVSVEVPPPYSGDLSSSTALVTSQVFTSVSYGSPLFGGITYNNVTCGVVTGLGSGVPTFVAGVTSFPTGQQDYGWSGLVRVGDLIRFGYQGRWYLIIGTSGTTVVVPPGGNATLSSTTTPGSILTATPSPTVSGTTSAPWVVLATDGSGAVPPATGTTSGVPYQIMRQPTKSAVPPLQLPEGVVIDLYNSGASINGYALGGLYDVNNGFTTYPYYPNPMIMFNQTGTPGFVYSDTAPPQHLPGSLFLLVGRREGMLDVNPGLNTTTGQSVDPSNPLNLLDMNNMWVAVSSQSGLVVTTENANTTAAIQAALAAGATSAQALTGVFPTARAFAQSASSMGGR